MTEKEKNHIHHFRCLDNFFGVQMGVEKDRVVGDSRYLLRIGIFQHMLWKNWAVVPNTKTLVWK